MFINQMSRSQRAGKVVGTLVITTCLLLGVVWLLGHLLLAVNPGATAIAGEPVVTSSDEKLVANSPPSEQSPSESSDDSSSDSLGKTDAPAIDSEGDKEEEAFDPSRYAIPDTAAGLANAGDSASFSTDPASEFDTPASIDQGSRFQNEFDQTEAPSFEESQTDRFAADSTDTQDWNTGDDNAMDTEGELDGGPTNEVVDEVASDLSNDEDLQSIDSVQPVDSQVTFAPPSELAVDESPDSLELDTEQSDPLDLDQAAIPKFEVPVAPEANTTDEPVPPGTDDPASIAKEAANAAEQVTTGKPALPEPKSEPEVDVKPTPQPKSPNLVDLTRRKPRTGRPLKNGGNAINRSRSGAAATYPVRTWTSVDGKRVQARYEGQDARNAVLRVGEKRYRVPFTRLSKGDLEYLRIIRQTDTRKKP